MKKITFICDLCHKKFVNKYDIRSYPLNIFCVPTEKDGTEYREQGRINSVRVDLCDSCLDKITIIEKPVGIYSTVNDDNEIYWRKRDSV